MISLQTNIDSLTAQENLNNNHNLQSKTIQQLTSGYRINSSADDAAGLAIANGYRSSVNELTQGVSNANDGVSQLQIVDGGLGNISSILDRMKTLATQSASGTFTGNRGVLNQEYQGLASEIDRQASNINLNSGGSFNSKLSVYIGGGNNAANSGISIDLSGSANAVDSTSLGLSGTSLNAGGTGLKDNVLNLNTAGATFVKGTGGSNDQTFSFNLVDSTGTAKSVTATLTASTSGSTADQVLTSLNNQLNQYGISASTDTNGALKFTGSTAFSVADNGLQGSGGTNAITDYGSNAGAAGAKAGENSSNYTYDASSFSALGSGNTDALTFTTGSGANIAVSLDSTSGATVASAVTAINAKTAAYGIYAVANSAGTGISFQSQNNFSIADNNNTASKGVFNNATTGAVATPFTSAAPTSSGGGTGAISAIDNAIKSLGLVQGTVGAGQNKLQYAISLAQSQISNFSAAESQIRDADVAKDASNLTRSQVLVQTSVAAMAQANSEPQSVLKLLQG